MPLLLVVMNCSKSILFKLLLIPMGGIAALLLLLITTHF